MTPPPSPAPYPSEQASLHVVCLCAEWCGSCREYTRTFAQAAAAFGPRASFIQLDIEDDAAWVDGIEVENFPTLLIARGPQLLFFGTVMPHPQTLARLVESALAGELGAPAVGDAAVAALSARLNEPALASHRVRG